MAFDIFSKRENSGKEPEIYYYDRLPSNLRIQIHHIIKEAIGVEKNYYGREVSEMYDLMRRILKKEYGVFHLQVDTDNSEVDILNFLLNSNEVDKVLDVVEICFRFINKIVREKSRYSDRVDIAMDPDDAIRELNERLKEHAVGYIFEANRIIRIDSTYTHTEITKPTLVLLSTLIFTNANEEYLKAHEHYRHGLNKECLAECLKAFESVMKIICNEKGWQYDEKDTASKLIKICFENELIPNYLQTQFTSLKAVLESGIPTIRNRMGGHGQGVEKKEVEDHLSGYALNLTGSNIVFLVEQSGL